VRVSWMQALMRFQSPLFDFSKIQPGFRGDALAVLGVRY